MTPESRGPTRAAWRCVPVQAAASVLAVCAIVGPALAAARVDVEGLARVAGHPHAGAVVWIEAPSASVGMRAGKVVLDQRNLTFRPHVLAVRVGTTVELPNNDRVFHNVFSFHDGKRFDLGLYPAGTVKHVTFDRAGLSRVFCNIHAGMAAYVMVVDTPYFAVSDDRGRFSIPSVPAGTYPYHAWHSGGTTTTGSVVVEPGARLEVAWP